MSTTIEPNAATASGPALPRRRWSEADFARMLQAGILRDGDGAYLVGGEIRDATAGDTRRRWTNEEADRLVRSGILREGGREFLWDGEVVDPMGEDNPHSNAVYRVQMGFEASFPAADWTVRVNFPVELSAGYSPQPDVTVLRGPRSSYRSRGRRPKPADVALLVEVSDQTYSHDRGEYLRKYASEGITPYWIVHMAARTVEVYSDPTSEPPGYRLRRDFGLDDVVPLLVEVDGRAVEFEGIAVRDILRDSLDEG